MNVPIFVFSALLLAVNAGAEEDRFTTVSIEKAGNAKWTNVQHAPVGRAVLGGVPFDLPESHPGVRTEGPRAKDPTLLHIPVDVARPEAIFLLFSGTYVKPQFKGKKVGEITLVTLKDTSVQTVHDIAPFVDHGSYGQA